MEDEKKMRQSTNVVESPKFGAKFVQLPIIYFCLTPGMPRPFGP